MAQSNEKRSHKRDRQGYQKLIPSVPLFSLFPFGLLPVSQTPSLGVMMKPEVVHGNEKNIQQRVQA